MNVLMVNRCPNVFDEVTSVEEWGYPFQPTYTEFEPGLDMVQDKDELVVRMELPGVKKEDIDVTVDGRSLTIKAEKKSPEFSQEAKYYSCERYFGTYSRSEELPFDVKADKVTTRLQDGVLEVRLPLTEASRPRHIPVSPTKKQVAETKTK